MRVEPHGIDSIVHCIKRGVRGMNIVRNTADKSRFAQSLYILNDKYQNENWMRDTASLLLFERPSYWPQRIPIVRILAWTLMPNHFHLLLQEIREGGIAKFMQRIGGSMALHFNAKYGERGTIFQGGYKGVRVERDAHLRYVIPYIAVKNVLELYPGGLSVAIRNFDRAWGWASQYPFSSFGVHARGVSSPIVEDPDGLIAALWKNSSEFKKEAREVLTIHAETARKKFAPLALEDW